MLTRRDVTHQYPAPCPHPATHPAHTAAAELTPRGGGLAGGAVVLNSSGWTGIQRGNSGYGYLGLDPSDPSTWIRPFNPAMGMIGYLNGVSR